MGKRGRQSEPAAVKLLKGNPGKRTIPEGFVKPVGELARPAYVVGYAAEVWRRVVNSMPPGVYAASDVDTLAAYCLAAASLREAVEHLWIEGEVITVLGQFGPLPRRNPWTAIRTEAMAKIVTLGTKLGLDPTSRETIPAPKEKPASKFAGLVGIDGGKAR